MNRILFTAAAGALAMYFLDPQVGRRRRVRTRDKADSVARRVREAYDVTLRDTRHSAMGMKAIGRRVLRRGPGDDGRTDGRVPGVRLVSNQLVEHKEAGNVSSLQGGVPRRGERFELMQDNWSPAARLAVGTVGLALLMRGGILWRLGGAALIARAITNLDFG